jgi:hypothetical protein
LIIALEVVDMIEYKCKELRMLLGEKFIDNLPDLGYVDRIVHEINEDGAKPIKLYYCFIATTTK